MLRSFLILITLVVALPAYAQNTCDYANDNECDEARYGGQGYCDAGTDTTDCSLVSQGISDDSCAFANDNECDEYRFGGTGSCQDGSDTSDCEAWVVDRESDFLDRARALGLPEATIGSLGDNTCRWSYDDECDDIIYGGTGACDPGTDASDCLPEVAEQGSPTPAGGDNSCTFANDNECDEARYGGQGFCDDGTDTNDCAAAAQDQTNQSPAPAGGDNSCVFANDDECDEAQYGGQGFCDDGTDTNDCSAASQDQTNLSPAPSAGDNSCIFANDNECDEERFGGQGFCDDGTDANDCAAASQGQMTPVPTLDAGDNSCIFANDNECDEERFGGQGFCDDGTDANDCAGAMEDQSFLSPVPSGDNSCTFANDSECDEAQYGGQGFCDPGTDTADCTAVIAAAPLLSPAGGNDSCEYANDSECDEARYGGGDYCEEGTDTTDCQQLALGLDDDSCSWANDGACDEMRYGGGGACVDGTDATDCDMFGTSPEALARLLALVPDTLRASLGDDSCQYSNDGECDDTAFGGTIYCDTGTDASDCRALAMGGEDSCRWANDNECDEPGIGTDNCTSGTDMTDCASVAFLRNRTDACNTAFDGVCNEPTGGNGSCEEFSDTADCLGRSRPAGLQNHFFGRDDRILVDATQMPWRAIGSLELQDGFCTGTLVGPSLVLTAAHCVTDTGDETLTPKTFTAGQSVGADQGVAKVVAAVFDPSYTPDTQPAGGGNGHDWALVTLDRPLGDAVGYLDVHELSARELSQIGRGGLLVNQAGYSWDTGDNLSGNQGCRIIQAFEDNSILHECDTAQGDSGSPFLMSIDGAWKIIGVDSTFFAPQDDKTPFGQSNLAVDSRAFAAAVAQQQ